MMMHFINELTSLHHAFYPTLLIASSSDLLPYYL